MFCIQNLRESNFKELVMAARTISGDAYIYTEEWHPVDVKEIKNLYQLNRNKRPKVVTDFDRDEIILLSRLSTTSIVAKQIIYKDEEYHNRRYL